MARKRQHDELEGLYKSDLEFLIDEITVGALAYRNKEILKDTLIEGHSYEYIGKNHGLSKTRVKTIVRKFCANVETYKKKHPDL